MKPPPLQKTLRKQAEATKLRNAMPAQAEVCLTNQTRYLKTTTVFEITEEELMVVDTEITKLKETNDRRVDLVRSTLEHLIDQLNDLTSDTVYELKDAGPEIPDEADLPDVVRPSVTEIKAPTALRRPTRQQRISSSKWPPLLMMATKRQF
jgi:hypothetical protein